MSPATTGASTRASTRTDARSDRASVRVGTALAVGIVAALVTGLAGRWGYAASVGWAVAALTFLGWTWSVVAPMDADATALHATREDPSKRISSLIVLGAAVASLVGVGVLLVRAGSESGAEQAVAAGLGVASVVLSWTVVHTLFALRYALLYYDVSGDVSGDTPGSGADDGGIDFKHRSSPAYLDFAYLAFTIGMTFQVSDTEISRHDIRITALGHALLSFLLGAVILAASVNLIASLASPGH